MHFYSWSKGLKTGQYYLRTKAKAAPQQFSEPDKMTTKSDSSDDYEEEECLMCGRNYIHKPHHIKIII